MTDVVSSNAPGEFPSISIVIPALNERAVIARTVAEVTREVERAFPNFEIILVDDGSSDGTGAIMDDIAAAHPHTRVLHNERNFGLGASYQRGVEAARMEYLMMLCGDGGLPASSLPPIFAKIGEADIVVPFILNLKAIKTPSRYFLSRTYTLLMNTLFGKKLRYYNGLPVHRVAFLRQISISSSGFGFQAEILIKLLKAGCDFVEVGVEGAELTRSSVALRPRNVVSIVGTFWCLFSELIRFKPPKLPRSGDPVSSEYSAGSGG